MPIQVSHHSIQHAAAAHEEIFAIGDTHGRHELLAALFGTIAATPRPSGTRRIVVLLGDLIDRGLDSLGCVDLAMEAREATGADQVVPLMGNHEQMLITAIGEDEPMAWRAQAYRVWFANGGRQVIYDLLEAGHIVKTCTDLRHALGADRVAWLEGLASHWTSGEIMLVHAGLSPSLAIEHFLAAPARVDFPALIEAEHWAWIRGPFLDHVPDGGHHGYFVAHGHTAPAFDPTEVAEQLRRCRINLDGGSFATGRARMARFMDRSLTVFEAP